MTRMDVPADKGQCDIRLQIDAEAEVYVRGDPVHIRTISGRDGRDDGSESNAPVPERDVEGFRFEVADGRGAIRLLSRPSRRSGYQGWYTFGLRGRRRPLPFPPELDQDRRRRFSRGFPQRFPRTRRDQIAQQGDWFRSCTSCA